MKAVAIGLLLTAVLAAQRVVPIDLQQAVDAALANDPKIAEARYAVEAAEARVRQARALYRPQLSFSGLAKAGLSGALNSLGVLGLANSPFFRNFALGFVTDYPLFDFGRREHALALEQRRHNVQQAELEGARLAAAFEAKRAYYDLLRTRRVRDVAAEVADGLQVTVRQARAFYEAQLRSRVELELAQAALARAQLRLLEAETGLLVANDALRRATGVTEDVTFSPAEVPLQPRSLPAVAELVTGALERRPEMRSIESELEAASEGVELARIERKPMLALGTVGGYARSNDLKIGTQTAAGSALSFPVYTGGRLSAAIDEADAQVGLLGSRREDLRLRIDFEVRSAHTQLKNAVASFPLLRTGTEAAQEAARLAAERYRERLGSIVELTQAQTAVAEASALEAAGLYQAKTAEAQLDFALGSP